MWQSRVHPAPPPSKRYFTGPPSALTLQTVTFPHLYWSGWTNLANHTSLVPGRHAGHPQSPVAARTTTERSGRESRTMLPDDAKTRNFPSGDHDGWWQFPVLVSFRSAVPSAFVSQISPPRTKAICPGGASAKAQWHSGVRRDAESNATLQRAAQY